MPGVQKPHCSPCFAQNDSCRACSWPLAASPSLVVTDDPSACAARPVHDFTTTPSSTTVQEPHWLVSHPILVPVRPATSRRKCTRSSRGSIVRCRARPLACMETEICCITLTPSRTRGRRKRGGDLTRLHRRGRQVIFRRNDQQHAAAFLGPQLAVIAAGVGVMEVARRDAASAGEQAPRDHVALLVAAVM